MITVPVREVTHSTPRTRILSLDVSAAEFSFTAGQAVMLGLNGSPLRKPYSIASAPWEVRNSGIMQVLVQIDSGGPDPHLELAAPGTPLDLEGPFGSFGLPDRIDRPMLFIAGGTGIAPLRSMLFEHLAFKLQPIALVYSARSTSEFAFLPELVGLDAGGYIKSYFTVTREDPVGWNARRGRISGDLLSEALPSPESLCLICGPPQLVSDASALLVQRGVSEKNILVEKY
ncbi:MAG: FAD-dependent oxidoreductase [Cyanobacteria bacterium]|nr:FAD-dependent oxidoreductase [Cyanobacteriota bacterium]